MYGILGANGAGKSTMINLITDNVSRDKDGGSITYCDGYNTCEKVRNITVIIMRKQYQVSRWIY